MLRYDKRDDMRKITIVTLILLHISCIVVALPAASPPATHPCMAHADFVTYTKQIDTMTHADYLMLTAMADVQEYGVTLQQLYMRAQQSPFPPYCNALLAAQLLGLMSEIAPYLPTSIPALVVDGAHVLAVYRNYILLNTNTLLPIDFIQYSRLLHAYRVLIQTLRTPSDVVANNVVANKGAALESYLDINTIAYLFFDTATLLYSSNTAIGYAQLVLRDDPNNDDALLALLYATHAVPRFFGGSRSLTLWAIAQLESSQYRSYQLRALLRKYRISYRLGRMRNARRIANELRARYPDHFFVQRIVAEER